MRRAGAVRPWVSGNQCMARLSTTASASPLHLRLLRGAGWMAAAVDMGLLMRQYSVRENVGRRVYFRSRRIAAMQNTRGHSFEYFQPECGRLPRWLMPESIQASVSGSSLETLLVR